MFSEGSDSRVAADPADLLLAVKGLQKHFTIHGSKAVLQACNNISFEIKRGETLGIVGESGSGKSTLGRCILRLLEPSGGLVEFQGHELGALSKRELRLLRKDMQIVYQEPMESLNPLWRIGTQIAEPLRNFTNMSKTERHARAVELLGLVGLRPEVADALPGALSTGMQQRCSIARAIAPEPKLVVLDEPTSALPPETETDIVTLLSDLQERLDLAYIFISHDLALVRRFCDRVAVMYLGQIVEIADRDELFARPRHPYTEGLLGSTLTPNPRARAERGDRRVRLEGEIPSPIDLPEGCFLASRCPFVLERCHDETQELHALSDHHLTRCWRAAEGELQIAGETQQLSERPPREDG
jgi:oligopeptide/dipeptide ABC transporter ATP-binding protein